MKFPRISSLKTAGQFRERLKQLSVELPFDEVVEFGPESPLAQPKHSAIGRIGNRFAILPMEGWDGTRDGLPTELTRRRWQRFGESGAKLIWGGEAVAVRPDGRANPNQLMINERTLAELEGLRNELVTAHSRRFGNADGLLVGLQLTHSGRFARPNGPFAANLAYHHPQLDQRYKLDGTNSKILTDDELSQLVGDFVRAAVLAEKIGFEFVDIKHCHGYLGHELLSGFDRPGKYGGSFENRTRFMHEIVDGIRADTNRLQVGVRLSVFDFCPFVAGANSIGEPSVVGPYSLAFGGDGTGLGVELAEPIRLIQLLSDLGIELVCTTAGSPYYTPHIQRPAAFPPSDGYLPPEDPLVGVARQINVTAKLKRHFPKTLFVGSGYSYLQDWLPNVAQAAVRAGSVDFVGLGRLVLSYHDLPADVLAGNSLARKRVCRTFSDCTTAPRNGMVSGCYPLDEYYKSRPERDLLVKLKKSPDDP
jgi:2,4-dienoyl-CoA reductase-like NADH-dependent reductase (Old Yellow Enzyme family)